VYAQRQVVRGDLGDEFNGDACRVGVGRGDVGAGEQVADVGQVVDEDDGVRVAHVDMGCGPAASACGDADRVAREQRAAHGHPDRGVVAVARRRGDVDLA
jgi:hypothetical protein